MSEDRYPTDAELEQIRQWHYTDILGWMAFVRSCGKYWPGDNAWGWTEYDGIDDFKQPTRYYHVSTGGWSGNEEIIDAMQENRMCWIMTWQEVRRGGHYVFSVSLNQATK